MSTETGDHMHLHYIITTFLLAPKTSRQINIGVQPGSQLNSKKRLIITNNGDDMLVALYNVRTIFRAVHVLHYKRTIKGRRPCKNIACHDNPKTRHDNNKCKWILLKRRVSLCLGDWLPSSHWRVLWLQATPIAAHALQCNLYDDHNQTNEFVHSATNSNVINNRI